MINEDDLNSKENREAFDRLIAKAVLAGKPLEEYLNDLPLCDEEKEAIIEYRKKLEGKKEDELLFVGKDDNLSSVYIVSKKFTQENDKFWVTVRFVLLDASQFYQNIREFLKDHDCKYENLAFVEELWEFAPRKNSYSRLSTSYKGPDGEMIYELDYDKPKWISLTNVSRTGMVKKVFEAAMSQLVDINKLNPKQEQRKSLSQTKKKASPEIKQDKKNLEGMQKISNAKFKIIITTDEVAEGIHCFAHHMHEKSLNEFHQMLHNIFESKIFSNLKMGLLDNEFYIFIQVATLLMGFVTFDKLKVQDIGEKYIIQCKKVAAVIGMSEEEINNDTYLSYGLRIASYQKAWKSFDPSGKSDPFINLNNLFWRIVSNIEENDDPNIAQQTISDFLEDKIFLVTIPEIYSTTFMKLILSGIESYITACSKEFLIE